MQPQLAKLEGDMDTMQRRLVAILCADIQGYSQHMDINEEQTITKLNNCRQIIELVIARNGGRIANTAGDSVVAEFGSVIAAVDCAVNIQKKLKEKNKSLSADERLEFRMGINLGDVYSRGEDILGDGVNVAARLEGLADAGGILISGSVYDSIKNKLPYQYKSLGEQSLKNIADPVRVYDVNFFENIEKKKTIVNKNKKITDKPSIAILPLDNMSNDPEQEYFSDGMTEDLITDLSKLSELLVISRHSTFIYKNKSFSVEQVGEELGVDYVLEGSIRKAGDKIRINAQLIEVKSGSHIWADRYDEKLEDIFTVQDEVIKKIVKALHLNITRDEKEEIKNKGTANFEAHDCYLRGLEQFYLYTKESAVRARSWFAHAIELDPSYAKAYALKARVHVYEYIVGFADYKNSLIPAQRLAEQAIELQPSMPQGHILLAWAYFWMGKTDEATIIGRHAISLDSNDPDARYFMGMILSISNREEEAYNLHEEVKVLNPLWEKNVMYLTAMGITHTNLGNYEVALDLFDKAEQVNPNFIPHHMWRFVSCLKLEREAEAKDAVKKILAINPTYSIEFAKRFFVQGRAENTVADTGYILDKLKSFGVAENT